MSKNIVDNTEVEKLIKVNPCTRCDNTYPAVIHDLTECRYLVRCRSCGSTSPLFETMIEAVEDWNLYNRITVLSKCLCGASPTINTMEQSDPPTPSTTGYYINCSSCGNSTLAYNNKDSAIWMWNKLMGRGLNSIDRSQLDVEDKLDDILDRLNKWKV